MGDEEVELFWGAARITGEVGGLARARVHAGSSVGMPSCALCHPKIASAGSQKEQERERNSFGGLWYRRGWIEENPSCLLKWWTALSWITQLFRGRTKIHLIKTWSFPGTDIKKVGKGMKILIIEVDNRNYPEIGVGVESVCTLPCPPSRPLYHLTAFSYLFFCPFFPVLPAQ